MVEDGDVECVCCGDLLDGVNYFCEFVVWNGDVFEDCSGFVVGEGGEGVVVGEGELSGFGGVVSVVDLECVLCVGDVFYVVGFVGCGGGVIVGFDEEEGFGIIG